MATRTHGPPSTSLLMLRPCPPGPCAILPSLQKFSWGSPAVLLSLQKSSWDLLQSCQAFISPPGASYSPSNPSEILLGLVQSLQVFTSPPGTSCSPSKPSEILLGPPAVHLSLLLFVLQGSKVVVVVVVTM
ncbi:uncharacterized protein LOC123511987 isoform X2 [Portunus trituberculatus]|uniref:uncharacterized protein LOC123511987 isoform X2 n=1 Tax=Portunus trituberculatus TaxID=210409 RepID=UPI001E1D0B1D|nr:uncharacterized protein LOC123511987 isoform X2 [Portunus trituberculatus]